MAAPLDVWNVVPAGGGGGDDWQRAAPRATTKIPIQAERRTGPHARAKREYGPGHVMRFHHTIRRMRFWIALAFLLVAGAARAEDGGADEWTRFGASADALQNATPADCETACKALESLERAAEHICAVAPEHCQEARARAAAAADRVRAACPQCAPRAEFTAQTQTGELLAVQSAPSHGGCAGCATAPASGARGALFALGLLLLLARIRRR